MEDNATNYLKKAKRINTRGMNYSVFTKAFLTEWLDTLEVAAKYGKLNFKVQIQKNVMSKLVRLLESEIALIDSGEAEKTYKDKIIKEALGVNVIIQLMEITLIEQGIPLLSTPGYSEIEKMMLPKKAIVDKALSVGKSLQEIFNLLELELAAVKNNEELAALDKEITDLEREEIRKLDPILTRLESLERKKLIY